MLEAQSSSPPDIATAAFLFPVTGYFRDAQTVSLKRDMENSSGIESGSCFTSSSADITRGFVPLPSKPYANTQGGKVKGGKMCLLSMAQSQMHQASIGVQSASQPS